MCSQKTTGHAERGFTLIELMIVVVIIGILAALAVPRFNSSVFRAKEKEADAILKQIYTMQQAYSAQHGQYATSSADLETTGWKPPTSSELRHYEPPTDIDLPATLTKKAGASGYCDRTIDADGTLTGSNC